MLPRSLRATLAVVPLLALAGCAADAAPESSPEGEPENVGTASDDIAAPSCAPRLAEGAVPDAHRAMLDTIAFTEGTAGSCGQDGYNTGFGFHCFSSCARHPNTVWRGGGIASSAAGRYQFLNTTWAGLSLPSFSPKNQDLGAMKLVGRRGVVLPTGRALTATEFTNAMKKLAYEWASLPYSPYGQPTKSLSVTRAKYCGFAGCDGAGGSAPTGGCVPGGRYCGGNKVAGDPGALYRCTGGSAGTKVGTCLDGCLRMSGDDDVCRGKGGCVAGSFYCGGDKVTGDPDALYRCTGGSAGTFVKKCANGCRVNQGDDDACR